MHGYGRAGLGGSVYQSIGQNSLDYVEQDRIRHIIECNKGREGMTG